MGTGGMNIPSVKAENNYIWSWAGKCALCVSLCVQIKLNHCIPV